MFDTKPYIPNFLIHQSHVEKMKVTQNMYTDVSANIVSTITIIELQ